MAWVEQLEARWSAEAIALRLRHAPGFVWLDSNLPTHPFGRYALLSALPLGEMPACLALNHARPLGNATPWPEPPLAIGGLSYGYAAAEAPRRLGADAALPPNWLAPYAAYFLVDLEVGRSWCIGRDAQDTARLREALEACAEPPAAAAHVALAESSDATAFCEGVRAAQAAMRRGEVYMLNLARHWSLDFEGEPFALYLALRRAGAVPLGAYLQHASATVMTRSMELAFDLDPASGALLVRPIKGTRAQGPQAAAQLRADPKERAEHTMLVDLLRNDVGKVARTGSVRWPQLFACEPYAHLVHLVSSVEGQLATPFSPAELLEALLPMGSITGTPKSSAMRLIAALEEVARGPFCGITGYLDARGAMRFAVTIRSATCAAGQLALHAGSGIVLDSKAEAEFQETRLKMRVYAEALQALSGHALPL